MQFGIRPDGIIERLALAANLVPTPIFDTQLAYSLARTVMVGTKVGVFDALEDGPLTSEAVARACDLDAYGTEKLLNGLCGAGYLHLEEDGRYRLDPRIAPWVVSESPRSVRDKLLCQLQVEWELMGQYEEFVRTGKSADLHEGLLGEDDWDIYQRGMHALAQVANMEVALRTPVPRGATRMLDIGGSHGLYSAEICRRHDGLSSTILDLPEAVEKARPLLAREGLGDRVTYQAGNALDDDLGEETYDIVLISQLAHHFGEDDNIDLAARVFRALRPGGVYVVQDVIRPSGKADLEKLGLGALLDLYFAVTSRSGTWTIGEIQTWQRMAGFDTKRPIWLVSMGSSVAQVVGVKTR